MTDRNAKELSVVVTGVSSGIGNGTARVLLAHGLRVFGSVRRPEDAKRLSAEFGGKFTPLIFDVTDENAVRRGAEQTRAALGGNKLCGLVNNAGIAVPGPLLELPIAELRRQMEVNLISVLTVTQAFFPQLGRRSDGESDNARIVNISSIAGKLALPFLGPYAAAKHGVEGLSDSLRRECMLYGIDVIVIDPGSVATSIWDKADALDLSPYARSPYIQSMTKLKDGMVSSGRKGSPPERVGALVMRALTDRNPKARYVMGQGNPMAWLSQRLPKRLLDRIIAKNLGLLPARS
ncbi:MAG TPA: SDR family oxidoreductase [Spirochaetia bacterium]|nr:SDR family oxidoreductase [Spirochaetia bacterium]